jgi:hypothetical protein
VTLYDDVAVELAGFRAEAESLMVDTVTVVRQTGALDPVTFEPVGTQVYAGKAKVQTYEAFEKNADIGGGNATVQRYGVHVPVGSFAPAVNDVVTVTSAVHDPHLAGRQYVVRALLHKGLATAYRLLVDDNGAFGEAP